ncbi:MAG: hypothetical protein CG439_2354, partial [Methylococcaceae bacterium NSP1-2]
FCAWFHVIFFYFAFVGLLLSPNPTYNVSFPSSGLGMTTHKLCLTEHKDKLVLFMTRQAELGNRHSQTGVWERAVAVKAVRYAMRTLQQIFTFKTNNQLLTRI